MSKVDKDFFDGINGLRALAILSVAFLHFGTAFLDYNLQYERDIYDEISQLRHVQMLGVNGVYLFFGISGFLVTIALQKLKLNPKSNLIFYKQRLSRIYPPYLASLVIFFFVQLVLNRETFQDLIFSFFASIVFLHDALYDKWSIINPVAWSLEIEIQFYLFAPLFLFLFVNINKATKFFVFFGSAIFLYYILF